MLLEFKTSGKNTYHRRKYLRIDTDQKTYTTYNPRMIAEGIEIKTGDYNGLLYELKKAGFTEKTTL